MKLFELPLLQHFLQKHIRDVHLALSLLECGIAFKDVGYGDVKHRVVLCLLPSFVVAANVQEGCHFPAIQNHQPVIELTFASCGNKGVALRLAWTHIADWKWSSLMRWPVSGL